MSTLTVTVKQRSAKGASTLEGSYQLPGSTSTKLAKKDGTTQFKDRASLNQTARRVAKALGWKLEFSEPLAKAAKKSVKSKTSKPKAKKATKAKVKKTAAPKAVAPSQTQAQPSAQ
jgi:hypothetical protein